MCDKKNKYSDWESQKIKRRIMSKKSDNSKSKTALVTTTSTCLEMFDYTEVRFSCDKCRKYLDPMHNSKKWGGGSCDQI